MDAVKMHCWQKTCPQLPTKGICRSERQMEHVLVIVVDVTAVSDVMDVMDVMDVTAVPMGSSTVSSMVGDAISGSRLTRLLGYSAS